MKLNNNQCIFIKDPHLLVGFPIPSNREDTFTEEIQNKWNFIANYVKKNNIPYVVFTGDLFDKMQMSSWNWKIINENINFLLNFIKNSGAKLYSIRGNHDEINGKNNNEDTIFKLMINLNILNHIGSNTPPLVLSIENKKINLYGFDWNPSDSKLKNEIIKREYKGDYNIAVLHTSVVDKKSGKEHFSCVSYDYLLNCSNKIDAWVLGHYHKGFPLTYYKDKYFINPWNLTRLSRVDYVLNDEHTPEFVHATFNVNNDNIIDKYKTIKIPFIKYDKAFKKDSYNLNDDLIDKFQFFTKIENKIESNFNESEKLKNMLDSKEIKKEVYEIVKECLS